MGGDPHFCQGMLGRARPCSGGAGGGRCHAVLQNGEGAVRGADQSQAAACQRNLCCMFHAVAALNGRRALACEQGGAGADAAQAQAGDTRQGLVQRSGWQVPADGLGGLSGCLSGLGAAWCRLGRLRMGAGKRGQRADHGDGQEHGRRALQAVFAVRRRRGMGEIVKEGHGVRCPVVAVKCLVSLAMCNEHLKTPQALNFFRNMDAGGGAGFFTSHFRSFQSP